MRTEGARPGAPDLPEITRTGSGIGIGIGAVEAVVPAGKLVRRDREYAPVKAALR